MPNAYYLKLGSGRSQFAGTSRDPHHVGWIKLTSIHWGEPHGASGGGGGSGKPTFTEVHVSKAPDRLSSHLMLAAHNGVGFDSALLDIADERTGRPTLRVNFSGVVIKVHSVRDAQNETFTLDFLNMEFNYNPIAEDELEDILQSVFKFMGLGPALSRPARP